jgi:hypothetical protein
MKTNTTTQKAAMAYAIQYPVRRGWGEAPSGESTYRDFGNKLWQCRVVLRHSRALAGRVLNGSITLREAFKEAKPQTKSAPSLPTLNSMRSSADEIAPAELNEFMRIFG